MSISERESFHIRKVLERVAILGRCSVVHRVRRLRIEVCGALRRTARPDEASRDHIWDPEDLLLHILRDGVLVRVVLHGDSIVSELLYPSCG